MPVRSGWAQLEAGYRASVGAYGRAEVGAHLLPRVGLFGFGEVQGLGRRPDTLAGVGLRWEF